eukprot:COSAG01_NODE_3793_length_5690_cov_6.048650_6_plen_78_part_00
MRPLLAQYHWKPGGAVVCQEGWPMRQPESRPGGMVVCVGYARSLGAATKTRGARSGVTNVPTRRALAARRARAVNHT